MGMSEMAEMAQILLVLQQRKPASIRYTSSSHSLQCTYFSM